MSFDARQIQFLQRLVEEHPTQRTAGVVAKHFCEHFSLGRHVGRFIEYHSEHHRMALSLLQAHDLPVKKPSARAMRADSAKYGGLSEKSLSAAPHSGSIAIKCLGNCLLGSTPLITPPSSYLVVTPEIGRHITCDRLMLVENLESFRHLEQYTWINFFNKNVMVIYRGDTDLSTGNVSLFLHTRSEPIWAFVDFDPAGLVIANSLPSGTLERLILPAWSSLRFLADTPRGRQLFDEQYSYAQGVLNRTVHPLLKNAWEVMLELRSGVTQERMMHAVPKSDM
ncbi:hypothetical protein MIZ03_1491 [Rhodoferax lithotrophicus]|uniref:DUF7281 domain-containing protein n=1 Tax=Rhodoferax lithotrophicus TaxID=2798804 RepID=A0ABM7MK11_9BURK|nr:hypothetical protein [Rhodoferax sp. MIZ03]BCO26608.1 hypothetical protein MIZ03_1491 [Rhodoferax sp. MIZ03]